MSRKHEIRRHYEKRLRPGRDNYDVLDWGSATSQRARFSVLVENVFAKKPPKKLAKDSAKDFAKKLAGKSLLDVGCGLGDLLSFLQERGIDVDYTGVDLSEKMLDAARRLHGDAQFVCTDVFAGQAPPPGQFDVVFCSGALNLNLGNNREFLPQAIEALLRPAREHAVFNLLHVRARTPDERYFYHDPEEVLPIVRSLGCRARLIDDYLYNDFTVICEKPARADNSKNGADG